MNPNHRRELALEIGKVIRFITTTTVAVTNSELDLVVTRENRGRAERSGDYQHGRKLLSDEDKEISRLTMYKKNLVEGQAALVALFAIQSLGRPLPEELLREIFAYILA